VRVRIAFGSDATTPPTANFDGFAFDNVFVGDKKRNVLVEHFTNSTFNPSVYADGYLDNLYDNWTALRGVSDFHDIRYHISYPASDSLNLENQTDPAARALYFSVSQPPATIMDGRLDPPRFTGIYAELNRIEIDRRALRDPKFDLTLTALPGSAPNKISVQLTIVADTVFNSPLIAQVALLENNVKGFRNVLRKQLFGSDGKTINVSWNTNDSRVQSITDAEINVPIASPGQLTLVAYVQDKNTREIYQSVVIAAPPVQGTPITGIDEPTSTGIASEIQIFPNPANGMFNFGLPDNFPAAYTWKIADQRGIVVLDGDFSGAIGRQKQVETSGLANGVYFVIIGAPEKPTAYRKLVIMNRN
jgi:hypothetical protein